MLVMLMIMTITIMLMISVMMMITMTMLTMMQILTCHTRQLVAIIGNSIVSGDPPPKLCTITVV
jgi:hypothetical protein